MGKELYKMTSAQQLLYYGLKYSLKPSVTNICASAHFEKDIDPELMVKALKEALRQMKSSSTRLSNEEGGEPKQYFSDEEPQGIEILDFSDKSAKQLDKYISKQSQSSFPNKSIDSQLYKIVFIKKPDGKYMMYLRVSHIAFDAHAVMQLVQNTIEIYAAMRDSQPIPENYTDPVPMFEIDSKYQDSPRKQRDMEFWEKEVFDTEPNYTSATGLKFLKKGHQYGKTLALLHPGAAHINIVLKKETADAVNSFAMEKRVSPQCVYWLAVRNYLSMVSGKQEDVTFYSTIAKRWNNVMKKAGGTTAQAIPVRLRIPASTKFEDACAIAETMKFKCYKHANLSTLLMNESYQKQYKKPIPCGYITTNMTYQPYCVEKNDSVPVHFELHSSGANPMQLYLTIMALDYSGDLTFNYDYNTYFLKPADIEAMHEYLVKFITKCVENPAMTLEELMDI